MKRDMKLVIYIIVLILVLIFGIKNITKNNNLNIRKIKNEIVELKDNKISNENNGKLVIVKGILNTKDNKLTDNDFMVSLNNATKLTRNIEIYRYHKKNNKIITDWDSTLNVPETNLYDKKTDTHYTNPISNISSQTIMQDAYIGEFIVDKDIFNNINNNKIHKELSEDIANKLQYLTKLNTKFYINNNYYTTVKDNNPLIGDIRVSFEYLDLNELKEVTIIAKQNNDKLEPYKLDDETEVFKLYKGSLSKKEILKDLEGTSLLLKIISIIIIIVTLVVGYFIFKNDIKNIIKLETKKTKDE